MANKNDKQTGVIIKVVGEDGNIFNIMGLAARAMKKAGLEEELKQMVEEASHTQSYEEAICKIGEFVELE